MRVSFRKATVVAVIFIALFAVAVNWRAFISHAKAEQKWHRLVALEPRKSREAQLNKKGEISKQERQGVVKKLWIADTPLRRQVHIAGERSNIGLYKQNDGVHYIETFYVVKGLIQEELFFRSPDNKELFPSHDGTWHAKGDLTPVEVADISTLHPEQRYRYFEADRATYDFRTNQLIAYNATFWTYNAEGHDPVIEPDKKQAEMIGKADTMTISNGLNPNSEFTAHNLQLEFNSEGGFAW